MLGDMREVIGWPMASAMSIIAATFWGALGGEWTGSFEEVDGGDGGFDTGFVRVHVFDWVDEYARVGRSALG